MADSDQALEVLIRSVLDTTGYRMNEAEAQKLKSAVASTSAVTKVANEEDAKTTEKLILSKRELKHVIGALGAEAVPELSRALSMLAYGAGPAAAVFALVGAFEAIRNGIKKSAEAAEEFNRNAATSQFAESAQAAADAWRDAVNAQAEYLRNLEEIKKGAHGLTVELNNQLQLIAAIQAAHQSQSEAEKTLALAKLKEDEVFGRVTESEAIKRRGDIEKKAIEDKAKLEAETFNRQQAEREHIIQEAAQKQAGLEKARSDAQLKLDAAVQAQASAKNAPTREDVRVAQEKADKAIEQFNLNSEGKYTLNQKLGQDTPLDIVVSQKDAQDAKFDAGTKQRLFNQAQRANAVNIKALQDDLATKEKAAKENADALAKARDEKQNAANNRFDPEVMRANAEAQRASTGSVTAQTHADLAARAAKLQQEFQTHPGEMTRAELAELLADILELGEKFFEQGKNAVTQQQLRAELKQLRDLINRAKQ